MLNEYQRQFVAGLIDFKVEFLAIGGMALKYHIERPTRDLDLWVPLDGDNRYKLANALNQWGNRYRLHGQVGVEAHHLKENLQIHYPEDEVCFLDNQNELCPILPDDGIDILTSVHADLIFADALSRASKWAHDNLTMHIASLEDAEFLKRYKKSIY